jgi:hypothetical protein
MSKLLEPDGNTNPSLTNSKSDNGEEQGKSSGQRDRKNVVKNIVKAFHLWLKVELTDEKSKETITIHNKLKTLSRMMTKTKFNNRLINSIASNISLNPMFERFLSTETDKWLDSSKIYDKVAHKVAIQLYLNICLANVMLNVPQAGRVSAPL